MDTEGRRRAPAFGAAVVLALLALAAWLLLPGLFFQAGGGGAYQDEAPATLPDGRVRIMLRVLVWGGGGPAAGRFDKMRLQLRSAGGGAGWHELPPEAGPEPVAGSALVFRFVVPADLIREGGGTAARLEYRFRYTFDGVAQEVPGRYSAPSAAPG
ncbi:hypothetical protein [Rubrivivax gelatinosus]|uniref:Uncharacterized protein n=1 Tax=Rubrivivax gelatinosus TaxID=28068 RepID=A0ABS1DZG3_RUBGE|nr:hypothetical protein [Rubrivivax gelatinosus]MBK1715492.1 hypothetical protein [Rubrivivax gelatinosus]